jgi:hypothetical protein
MSIRAWMAIFWGLGLILSQPAYSEAAVHGAVVRAAQPTQAKPVQPVPAPIPAGVQNDIHAIASVAKSVDAKVPIPDDSTRRAASAAEWASNWALGMLIIAGLETLVTLSGVILVYRTLKAAWATRGEAKRAADAAHATLAHMQTNAQLELRAYLSVEPMGITALDYGTMS